MQAKTGWRAILLVSSERASDHEKKLDVEDSRLPTANVIPFSDVILGPTRTEASCQVRPEHAQHTGWKRPPSQALLRLSRAAFG